MKHRSLSLLLPILMWSTIGPALPAAGSVQNWGPNGNGTLDHKDDIRWLEFHDARVTSDPKAGVYTAAFGPFLRKLDGQTMTITGYMMALDTMPSSIHFVLTRRSPGCPFCPPNEPTEAIEIFSTTPIKTTPSPITIEGKLHLISRSEQGLFFRIDNAKLW